MGAASSCDRGNSTSLLTCRAPLPPAPAPAAHQQGRAQRADSRPARSAQLLPLHSLQTLPCVLFMLRQLHLFSQMFIC